MLRKLKFLRKEQTQDYSKFFGDVPLTPKQRLIRKCERAGVSIYVDDPSETSGGSYAIFRGVASEAELERRLNARAAVDHATRANVMSALAFIVAVAAFVKSFFSP